MGGGSHRESHNALKTLTGEATPRNNTPRKGREQVRATLQQSRSRVTGADPVKSAAARTETSATGCATTRSEHAAIGLARLGKVELVTMPRTVMPRRTVTDNSGGKSREGLPGHTIITNNNRHNGSNKRRICRGTAQSEARRRTGVPAGEVFHYQGNLA